MVRSNLQRMFEAIVVVGGTILISALFIVAATSPAATPATPLSFGRPATYV